MYAAAEPPVEHRVFAHAALIAPVRLPRSDHLAIAPILDICALFLYFAFMACFRLVGGVFDLYDLLRRRPESEAQAEPRERDCATNFVLHCAFLLAMLCT